MYPKCFWTFRASLNLSIFTFFLLLIRKALSADPMFEECSAPKKCGDQNISYPFWIEGQQESYCGYPGFGLTCKNDKYPILRIPDNEYVVQEIFYTNQSLRLYNPAVLDPNNVCFPRFRNMTPEDPRFENYSSLSHLILMSNCSLPLPDELLRYKVFDCHGDGRDDDWGLLMCPNNTYLASASDKCVTQVVAPIELLEFDYYFAALKRGFVLKWIANNCSVCRESGGNCGFDHSNHFRCFCPDRPHAYHCSDSGKKKYRLILGAAIPGCVVLAFVVFIIWRQYKWNYVSSYFLSRDNSSDPSSRADLEGGSLFFGVPLFSYKELEEATNNFDPNRELGDGGFGTVYHGKLRDGREVAVKRLYEHNYKRVEQFKNEIEILTRLRHQNLVTLYGCTSRHSRELLLVYEYIPNGTVADHLHGDQAKAGSLPWSIRMNIAIETATALAYLHASDIIHRDVKTNNILLDNNFCVKVADFGLSRLFPTDVTHVSTAPQGTPGYVDPEYHQCYQLTDKSDVYSFGVVLMELISSLPAVDIGRHRHEINLAKLAVNRIQNSAFNELVDPCLGFESDGVVQRMTTSVAELAFQCLQYEREMRPTMDDVLETLMEIQGQECKDEKIDKVIDNVGVLKGRDGPPPSPESDAVVLLKSKELPPSPVSVTDCWFSTSTTSNKSG